MCIIFEMALDTVITEVLGWNVKNQVQEKPGLFGTIDAYTISVEEQGQGTLHAHILIWKNEINSTREA